MSRVTTHSMGVLCAICRDVLIEDKCRCGERHGSTFQEASPWAQRTWPNHPCFIGEGT